MVSLSRSERTALCNAALEAGESAPTLCGKWSVKDLVIHLLLRERDPLGAPGILVPKLEFLADRSARRLAKQDFVTLVERLRNGPPRWSPFSLPPLERAVNTLEFFVHHEDIRRAQPGWTQRDLTEHEQKVIWKAISVAGKGLVRSAGVPVRIRWPREQHVREAVLRPGSEGVCVSGPPTEVAMFVFGRPEHGPLEFEGPARAVRALRKGDLGV